ncbi:MAG: NAD(P)-dependent oxidoreductase [Luteolibacter sp.]|uniref:SDR family oxidoreductase n=1 Tax=Luteolibacter sp. TaxID=1962973 RepID=UPI003263A59F
MRISVTGTTGRVGAALANHLAAKHEVIPLPRSRCDLADRKSLAAALEKLECDVLINPAGITSLEDCEDDPAMAMRVNAEAPAEIADWAQSRGVPVFHFSTDYVFNSDTPRLFNEDETPEPISVYGRSKLAGERKILARPGNCVIRVSWVYGPEKSSFVDRVFDDALAGRPIAAVADKFSLPVLTTDLAEWLDCLIDRKTTGIIHACNSGEPVSWHDMAIAVVEEMKSIGLLSAIPSVERQKLSEMASFRAARPRHSSLATHRLTEILGHPPRPWREALAEHVRQRSLLR